MVCSGVHFSEAFFRSLSQPLRPIVACFWRSFLTHSNLLDNNLHERMRGATPPNVYELALREKPFHGVQALRLNPVGSGNVFGRTGLLAHTYMLGPKGESNGCVVFKNYSAFLRAFQNGGLKRLIVVDRLD